jgi:hypothetical protein
MKKQLSTLFAALCVSCPSVHAACHVDDAAIGTVKATVIGIEVQGACTYVLLKNVQTTLPAIDNNPFVAGRFAYLALDPAHAMYKPFLTTAAMAMHTGQRVYATVQSRTAVVSTLAVATEENSLQ